MYTAMIVDEEVISRIGISSIINWNDYKLDIVAQASNGEEALEIIKQDKPDLIISEMNLNKISGIDLMKECRKLGIDTEFVIISGTNEFSQVKESLQLGAIDYILKNEISQDKMKEVLQKSLERIEAKSESNEQISSNNMDKEIIKHAKHNYLKSLLLGTKGFDEMDEDLLDTFGIELSKSRIVVMVIKNETVGIHFNHEMISETIEKLASDYDHLYFSLTGRGEITLLYNFDYHSDLKDNESIRSIANRFAYVIKQYFNTNIAIYVSDIFPNITSAPLAYLQACQAYNARYIVEELSIVYYKDIKTEEQIIYDEDFEKPLRVFKKALEKNDGNTCIETFDILIDEIESNTLLSKGQLQYYMSALLYMIKEYATDKSLIHVVAEINEHSSMPMNKLIRKKEVISSLNSLKDKFVQDLRDRESCSIYVIKIKEFIRKNYNHKISLEELAREIGLSYTYMSTLFKKEVGENIMDFLINCRIDAAKVMLMEGQYQISYISSSVGYENEHYFSRMFKQRTSMTPTAFRQGRI